MNENESRVCEVIRRWSGVILLCGLLGCGEDGEATSEVNEGITAAEVEVAPAAPRQRNAARELPTGLRDSSAVAVQGEDEASERPSIPGAGIESSRSPDIKQPAEPPAPTLPSLDVALAELQVPPPWLEAVSTAWDESRPWQEARLEIRRLLGLNQESARREALKLTWVYWQKKDMNDGHEYPMYTHLGAEPVWSVRAHEEYLALPHESTPIHALLSFAAIYRDFGEFEKAAQKLDEALNGLPDPPWRVMRKAELLDAYGDLYCAWGRIDDAKKTYAESVRLYPTARPQYGAHLLPHRAAKVQAKLDLLLISSLENVRLRDGQYRDKSLGYAEDVHVTVTVRGGRISDIDVQHQEKIDQNACVLIPQRIIQQQSLQVDGVSGATITKDAIIAGTYRALKKAGLE